MDSQQMREKLAEGWRAFREFEENAAFDGTFDRWGQNFVAIVIVSLPLLMLGTCSFALVRKAASDDPASVAAAEADQAPKRNPWSLDKPAAQPR